MVTLLVKTPSTVPFTSTLMVQLPTGKEALVKVTLVAPATGANVPPQVLLALGEAATTMFAGNPSVKLASTGITLGLLMLKVIVDEAFTATTVGLKLLVMCNGSKTMILAVAVAWSTKASALPPPATFPALKVAVAVPLA